MGAIPSTLRGMAGTAVVGFCSRVPTKQAAQDRRATLWPCLFQPRRYGAADPWIARHGLTSAQYQAAFNQFVGEGYLLDWVSGYFDGTQDLYAAIWRAVQRPRLAGSPWPHFGPVPGDLRSARGSALQAGGGMKLQRWCAGPLRRYLPPAPRGACMAGPPRPDFRAVSSGLRPARGGRLPAGVGQWLQRRGPGPLCRHLDEIATRRVNSWLDRLGMRTTLMRQPTIGLQTLIERITNWLSDKCQHVTWT